MKLNNKGFAISTVMYMILIMAIVLITLTLALLSSRKFVLDKIKDEALNNIYNTPQLSYRQLLNTLKNEAIVYAQDNNIENGSVKVSELNSSIDNEILKEYELLDKVLLITNADDIYEVNLEI